LPVAYWPEGYLPFLATRPHRGCHVPHLRDATGVGVLYTPGPWCPCVRMVGPDTPREPLGQFTPMAHCTVFVNHLSGAFSLSEPHRGFTRVRPSSLPLACGGYDGWPPLGFHPLLRTAPLPVWPLGGDKLMDTSLAVALQLPHSHVRLRVATQHGYDSTPSGVKRAARHAEVHLCVDPLGLPWCSLCPWYSRGRQRWQRREKRQMSTMPRMRPHRCERRTPPGSANVLRRGVGRGAAEPTLMLGLY
jgi:hypothetical protein